MRLYLVRHLPPQVAAGTCYGRTDLDVDAALLAQALPDLLAQLPGAAPVIASPLRRCASLAQALADASGVPVRLDARLAELDFGAWEMRSWSDIDRTEIDAWAAQVDTYHPGGGESVLDMAHRIAAFYAELRRARPAQAVVVCHAGAIRLLCACHAGLAPSDMAREAAARPHAIGYGEIVTLDCV